MEAQVHGARGSVASPGPRFVRYGGNTSCVQVTLSDGTTVVLDAGTGIRNATPDLDAAGPVHVLLTHLHLDHIQGLLFFSPLFKPQAEITIWGPEEGSVPLQDRIGRYLSAPLTPIEVRELPCHLDFRNCPVSEWRIGPATIRAEAVTHRGPTLGYRIEDAGGSLCYLPDHEPALVGPIDALEDEWLSGFALADGVDLLLHDSQYTDDEYPSHFGWGHSSVSHAMAFAARAKARRTVLFHHDPYHDDDRLDAILGEARERWTGPGTLELAIEGSRLEVATRASRA